jgi:hypothetical protein
MAKPGRRRKSTSAYFKAIFEQHPELLHGTSNQQLIEQWRTDHPNRSAKELRRVKARLANLKSQLRKQEREGKAGTAVATRQPAARATPAGSYAGNLEDLEVAIDDCLTRAKVLDPVRLEDVIKHLRQARNIVVWRSGQ